MKTKKMNLAVLSMGLGVIMVIINVFLEIIWRFQPVESGGSIDNLSTTLLAIILHVALLGYGYVLLRKIVPQEKAQWHLVLTSTVALTISTVVAELIGFFILHIGPDIEYRLNFIIILLSLIMNFLLSLGAVYVIAQFYKRRSSFEVE